MMKERILVVDDEKDIQAILQYNLEKEGFVVDVASSAEEAENKLTNTHRLILLDVMMEGISGFTLAERLRKKENHVPIIFLTAKNSENDVLTGFSSGGDDYIAKPFSMKEVVARVKALLRRVRLATAHPVEDRWRFRGLEIDLPTNRVTVEGKEVSLTKKEFEILTLLVRVAPNVLTRVDILDSVWSEHEYVLDRTVDVHITRLRKKLGKYAHLIVSRSGFGYCFNLNAEEQL